MPEEKDVQDQSSGSIPESVESPASEEKDGSAPDTSGNPPWHKDKRFKEFLAEKKKYDAYRELGDPDTLKEAVAKSQMLDALVQATPAETKDPTADEKKLQQYLQDVRRDILAALPELGQVFAGVERTQALITNAERAARKETKSLLEAHGLSAEKQDVFEMEEHLASVIRKDEDLAEEFYIAPRKVVQAAFAKSMKKFKDAASLKAEAEKQRELETTTKLPKAHPAGGGSGASKVGNEPPRSLKDAERLVRSRLEGMG